MPPRTALRRYERLESPGLWRESHEAQRREVIVGLREATLILSDPKSEQPLSQWSLPAIQRLNPGEVPALYSPSEDGIETLEVDDRDMVAALDTVHSALEHRKPHPGRLRNLILGAAARFLVTSLATAGQIIGLEIGLAFAQTADPTMTQSGQLTAVFLSILGVALIFATGFISLNMIADILAIVSNPRLRHPR